MLLWLYSSQPVYRAVQKYSCSLNFATWCIITSKDFNVFTFFVIRSTSGHNFEVEPKRYMIFNIHTTIKSWKIAWIFTTVDSDTHKSFITSSHSMKKSSPYTTMDIIYLVMCSFSFLSHSPFCLQTKMFNLVFPEQLLPHICGFIDLGKWKLAMTYFQQ